jgi:hypothetical protein
VSKYGQVVGLLLHAVDNEAEMKLLEEELRQSVDKRKQELGLVAAGGLAPPLQLQQPQLVAARQVMQNLPALPKVPVELQPYTGVGIAYPNALNNNGGKTEMKMMNGESYWFNGLMCLKIHSKLEIKLSHQQQVPNIEGCSFAEAIIQGYPIHGPNNIATSMGTFPFATTSGKVGSTSHSFYRESQGSPLFIITMQGTFAVLTNVLFQTSTYPLG